MGLESVDNCPICSGKIFEDFIEATDFTTTRESFKIVKCIGCQLLLTNPRPTSETIPRYYQSDKYISHTGGRRTFADKIYIAARSLTLRWKYKLISNYCSRGTILDYGCGTGEFLNYLKKRNWSVQGIEPSDNARTKANQLLNQKMVRGLAEIPPQEFKVITLWHVLEHVHQLNETIQLLKRYLHKDGTLFIAVPNYQSADATKYKNHWAAYDVPRHLWHFSKETMTALLAKHGLTVQAIKPMLLDAFYVSMLSENYKHSHQPKLVGLLKAMMSGLASNLAGAKNTNQSSLIYIVKK